MQAQKEDVYFDIILFRTIRNIFFYTNNNKLYFVVDILLSQIEIDS